VAAVICCGRLASGRSGKAAPRTTNNFSERGAKAVKGHQVVFGCWHTLATLARWCRIRSYLDSAAAHGIAAIDAIRDAVEGTPGCRPLPEIA
jgi:hypothetical protein